MLSEFKSPNTGLWFTYSKTEPICRPKEKKLFMKLGRRNNKNSREKKRRVFLLKEGSTSTSTTSSKYSQQQLQ